MGIVFNGHNFTPMIHNETNEPWFLGKEIKNILGIKNLSDAIKNAELEADEFTIVLNDSGIGGSKMTILSESGLYGLIGNSRKQIGKELRKFVRKEVLPSIRKNGEFKLPTNPQEQALILAKNLIEMQKQVEAQKPAVEFCKTLSATKDSIKVGEFAKILFDKNSLDIGQNRLFQWLYKYGYLQNSSTPYQKYVSQGIFEVSSGIVKNSESGRIWKQVLITGKGMIYLSKKILDSKEFEVIKAGI
jgi:prophage antirepressor-like protein